MCLFDDVPSVGVGLLTHPIAAPSMPDAVRTPTSLSPFAANPQHRRPGALRRRRRSGRWLSSTRGEPSPNEVHRIYVIKAQKVIARRLTFGGEPALPCVERKYMRAADISGYLDGSFILRETSQVNQVNQIDVTCM